MVQDYFVRRQRGQNCQEWEACIPFLTVQSIVKAKNTDDLSVLQFLKVIVSLAYEKS